MLIIVTLFLVLGCFFFAVGVIGLIRFPDTLTRLHATTKCDTLGAGLVLVGLSLYFGLSLTSAKLILIVVFVWITNPTAAHVIANSTFMRRALASTTVTKVDK